MNLTQWQQTGHKTLPSGLSFQVSREQHTTAIYVQFQLLILKLIVPFMERGSQHPIKQQLPI